MRDSCGRSIPALDVLRPPTSAATLQVVHIVVTLGGGQVARKEGAWVEF